MKKAAIQRGQDVKTDQHYLEVATKLWNNLFDKAAASSRQLDQPLQVKSRVAARWKGGQFYPGEIAKVHKDGTFGGILRGHLCFWSCCSFLICTARPTPQLFNSTTGITRKWCSARTYCQRSVTSCHQASRAAPSRRGQYDVHAFNSPSKCLFTSVTHRILATGEGGDEISVFAEGGRGGSKKK